MKKEKVYVTSQKQKEFDENFKEKYALGYITNGEPTDAQVQLQDRIDNEIFRFLQTIRGIYLDAADIEYEDMEWDIDKITEVRIEVENVLNLPSVYIQGR